MKPNDQREEDGNDGIRIIAYSSPMTNVMFAAI